MKRLILNDLRNWFVAKDRKPLIIRGARQVGKTWLVRHFAKEMQKECVEINFEKNPSYSSLFDSNDPKKILLNISAALNQKIELENCILFLDEIQVSPIILSKLRWFAEELSQLPLIAAGSLLEFVLSEHSFSMPVGRISYMHLEPLSFEEFLLADNKNSLFDYLQNHHLNDEIPYAIHQQLCDLFKEYIYVGGMPAVVSSWISEHSFERVNQIQHDLLATYRNDFTKYKSRIILERIDEVMMAVPKFLSEKFVFSRVNANIQANTIKQVLTLLEKARVCTRVQGCSGNGIPIGAETKEKIFKEIFLDVGLCNTALGLNAKQFIQVKDILMINNGGIAEQVAGQLLRTIEPYYIEPSLYCWYREEKGSNAEIDYLLQHSNKIIPIEVKAGKSGSLKSLHLFMSLKNHDLALRINADIPSITAVNLKNPLGEIVNYKLISIPFYLISQIHRLLNEINNVEVN